MAIAHKHDELFYVAEKVLPNLAPARRVLDVGAGSGWAGALIKQRFPESEVVACDISPAALVKGGEIYPLLGSSVDYRVSGDTLHLPFEDGYFDLVFACATLHHVHELERGTREIARVLAPGGRIVATLEPAAGHFLGSLWASKGLPGERSRAEGIHEKMYSLDEWRAAFAAAGFSRIEIGPMRDWRYRMNHWITPVYYRSVSFLPDRWFGNFLPCSFDLRAWKSG
jgi:ubiquinone/menaquinone biosynthesis C-methylase UbiE